jgi:hypothetical protein
VATSARRGKEGREKVYVDECSKGLGKWQTFVGPPVVASPQREEQQQGKNRRSSHTSFRAKGSDCTSANSRVASGAVGSGPLETSARRALQRAPCLSIERSWELPSKKQGGHLDGKTCARRTVARVFESPCESRLHSCGSVWTVERP